MRRLDNRAARSAPSGKRQGVYLGVAERAHGSQFEHACFARFPAFP